MGCGTERRTYYQVECDCGAIAGCAHTTKEAAARDWNRRANGEGEAMPTAKQELKL